MNRHAIQGFVLGLALLLALVSPVWGELDIRGESPSTVVPVGRDSSFELSVVNSGPVAATQGRITIGARDENSASVSFDRLDFNLAPGASLAVPPVVFRPLRMTPDHRLFIRVLATYTLDKRVVRQTVDFFTGLEDGESYSGRWSRALALSQTVENQITSISNWQSHFVGAPAGAESKWLMRESSALLADLSNCRFDLNQSALTDGQVSFCEARSVSATALLDRINTPVTCVSSLDCSAESVCTNGECALLSCSPDRKAKDHVCVSSAGASDSLLAETKPDSDNAGGPTDRTNALNPTGAFALTLPDIPFPLLALGLLVLGIVLIIRNRPRRPSQPAMRDLRYM